MAKRVFNAFLGVRATVYYNVTIDWKGKEDPTEEEIINAYTDQTKGFEFVECETVESDDDMDVSDIEEDEEA